MKLKLFLAMVAVSFLMTGCLGFGGDTAVPTAAEGFHYYATDSFRIQIPNEWEVIKPVSFKSDTPGNTIIGFRNNVRNARFTSNVVIIKNEVSQDVSTLDYAKALYAKVVDSLNDFKEITTEQRKITVGSTQTDTLYTVSEGRESTTADLKQFFYSSGVSNKKAYIAIGSMLTSEGEATAKKLEAIVKSFEVK